MVPEKPCDSFVGLHPDNGLTVTDGVVSLSISRNNEPTVVEKARLTFVAVLSVFAAVGADVTGYALEARLTGAGAVTADAVGALHSFRKQQTSQVLNVILNSLHQQ